MSRKEKLWLVPTFLKYILAMVMLFLAYFTMKNTWFIRVGLVELALIFTFFNWLKQKSMWFELLHVIVLFFFDVWTGVVFFGSSYVTLVMLENLVSVMDLIGKIVPYLGLLALVLLICFFPGRPIPFKHLKVERCAPIFLGLDLLFLVAAPIPYTPAAGMDSLYHQWQDHKALLAMMAEFEAAAAEEEWSVVLESSEAPETSNIASADASGDLEDEAILLAVDADSPDDLEILVEEGEDATVEAPAPSHSDGYGLLGSDKNVIVIFMEGLSRNVVFDERSIMPNIAAFSGRSINVVNYYNHTFATYRGLQGQLYSGYSLNDQDPNHLASMMDVLRGAGYYSAFINTEPYNELFTSYLNDMSFDTVISDSSLTDGYLNSLSDEQAYAKVMELGESYQAEGRKFFLACYTFGSHASFDSTDRVYGDGSNAELNKFYNADYWFGWFYQQFINSPLASNTVLIFTTDHCTYADNDFVNAFPLVARPCSDCAEVPLYIYYQGNASTLDAQGRNTLDFAPTVLDLLGLDSPSTFLGSSLYKAKGTSTLDTYFWDSSYLMYTGNDSVQEVSAGNRDMIFRQISSYFAKK